MERLDGVAWRQRRAAHESRVDALLADHLERRRRGESHPVHDFLFTYYNHRPGRLRRWHAGWGVALAEPDADALAHEHVVDERGDAVVAPGALDKRATLVRTLHRLLRATASRPAQLGCFGLHEWAMVYRTERPRHTWPLRLGATGTDEVVEQHRIACTHFDAYRFFTPDAAPLNALRPRSDDREAHEQPGCLHGGMDLYKHAYRLGPLVPAELVVDAFELARDIRVLDMRASPYDFSALPVGLGEAPWSPVTVETAEGKKEYVAAQRAFADRGQVIRRRLLLECGRLMQRQSERR